MLAVVAAAVQPGAQGLLPDRALVPLGQPAAGELGLDLQRDEDVVDEGRRSQTQLLVVVRRAA